MDSIPKRRPHRQTLTDRLANLFATQVGEWHGPHTLANVAGFSGWRARISECRQLGFTIENRQHRLKRGDGSHVTLSEYRCTTIPSSYRDRR